MELSKILESCKCCACEAPLSYSRQINMAILEIKPTWQYPSVGNVLTNEENKAVAFVCDRCQEAGEAGSPPDVKYAIEFNDDEVLYHSVSDFIKVL